MAKSGWIQTLQSKPDKNVKQQFILNIRSDKVKNMANISIRTAKEADRMGISKVIAFAFEKDFSTLIKDMDKVSMALESGIDVNRFFVAESENQIIGVTACTDCDGRAVSIDKKAFRKHFGLLRGLLANIFLAPEFTTPLPYPKSTGYIEFVAVTKNARNKGVAAAMLKTVVEQTNYDEYMLDVTDINIAAQACYTKFGFVEVKRVKEKNGKQKGFNEKIYMRYPRF